LVDEDLADDVKLDVVEADDLDAVDDDEGTGEPVDPDPVFPTDDAN
jgi:hypothetical protein